MARAADPLARYNAKRDFARTAEPQGEVGDARTEGLRFLVQKHDARRLHYDLRLEWRGVLLSWAVTRGPSLDPGQKRLAVRTEDHPLSYGTFEGTIATGQYGAGTVMLWDEGIWLPENDPDAGLEDGKLGITLRGQRMRGSWALVRMRGKEKRENWLLIKHRDDEATDDPDRLTEGFDVSVTSGRTMEEIASGAPGKRKSAKKAGTKRKAGTTKKDVDRPAVPARRKARPAFRQPQLATLVAEAPEGDGWLHETKFDGYRCLAALGRGGTRFWTRAGKDWTDRFGVLEPAFDPLPCGSALIDGEVMAQDVNGSAFSSLQEALSAGGPLTFFAFDLLALDGEDVAARPLVERKARLADLMAELPPDGPLRLSAHVEGGGPDIFARACAAGGEGIVCKRADAPYRSGRGSAWLKVKCTRRQEFVVGGTSPSDKRGRPFASLLVGENGPDGLRYRGRVGSGFKAEDFATLTAALRPRKTSPFLDVPREVARQAEWVQPTVVVEVDFAELTADGHIRHGTYLGLRQDKEAADVTIETPQDKAPADGRGSIDVGGIRISHPDRVIFPDVGRTKGDLARYYESAGDRLLAIAGRRPLSLVRLPDGLGGERFFQKHAGPGFSKEVGRIEVEESDGKTAIYMQATSGAAFVAAAQMGTVEFHVWGARVDRLERPDRLVFDLDPDEGLGWPDVRSAATDLRNRLTNLGLASIPVVTGGKGVHVCVCLRRIRGWETVKLFAKTLAHIMAEAEPDRFTATMSKARRTGRIFVDWLRNERGATAIAPYSVRARPGAPVAVPLTWDEFATLEGPATFRMDAMEDRLAAPCPYLAATGDLQFLSTDTIERLGRSMR